MDTTFNLDSGPVRAEAVGDSLRITFGGQSFSVTESELSHFILGVRSVARAAGAENYRRWEAGRGDA